MSSALCCIQSMLLGGLYTKFDPKTTEIPNVRKRASGLEAQKNRITKAELKVDALTGKLNRKQSSYGSPAAGTAREAELLQLSQKVKEAQEVLAKECLE